MEHLKYRPDIDGLRAVAVLSVVIFHYFPSILPGGFVGVDIFFVISGYLITSIILKSASSNSFSYVEFYKRRILRIFPALSIVLISCIIIGWVYFFQ
ncbi:acyltransferase, partial [Salmonella enterica subsp. enterica serovar Typhimurium]|nr:acyltransferase [Salmonella enterica subsp. enterica serovar Typhimurium]EDD3697537.1 acyltransferase family protein [Salmonella enterica subsp. enterica serovar Typhimurium]